MSEVIDVNMDGSVGSDSERDSNSLVNSWDRLNDSREMNADGIGFWNWSDGLGVGSGVNGLGDLFGDSVDNGLEFIMIEENGIGWIVELSERVGEGGRADGSGDGGRGGKDRSSLYCLDCFGLFSLVGAGSGPDRGDRERLVFTINKIHVFLGSW